jgi:flavodoxin
MNLPKKFKRMLWIIFGLVAIGTSTVIISVISIEKYQYNKNQEVIKNLTSNGDSSRTLVVFFSRSGNTELMARKIANLKKGHVIPIRAERYRIGLMGWIHSLGDARDTITEITPDRIDLNDYDTIYIGSPIWLYSPAPPVFEFAKRNDFTGKKVIMFNSMNSKFEQKYIDQFKSIIVRNGGTFEKHIYVIRGRMTQQMETNTFLNEVEKIVQ